MNEQICNLKHKQIEETLDLHNERLNSHSQRLDVLDKSNAVHTNQIDNLCKQIADLVTTLKWLIGLTITTLLAFFIWVMQSNIKFK